jgi:hypothetical protein
MIIILMMNVRQRRLRNSSGTIPSTLLAVTVVRVLLLALMTILIMIVVWCLHTLQQHMAPSTVFVRVGEVELLQVVQLVGTLW